MNYFTRNRRIIAYIIKEKIKNNFDKIIFNFFSFIIIYTLIFSPSSIKLVNASTINNNKLIERISKDYTNRFWNSLAFGLSKESAMNFSNNESNMTFKKKKGFDSLDKDLLATEIAISVVENCGYIINLRGEKGSNQFKLDYLSKNN